MQSCPNIGGREIRMRLYIFYFSLMLTLGTIFFIFIFNSGQLRFLVFFPASVMTIVLFETLEKTCVVYAYLGIKNLGEKYKREKNFDSLKVQRFKSLKIIIKGLITAMIINVIVYFLPLTI
tara:strand:+ start:171 stop:533 length:363 start_codon:yes stop_codon:yes gene_type:complete